MCVKRHPPTHPPKTFQRLRFNLVGFSPATFTLPMQALLEVAKGLLQGGERGS